MGSLLSLEERLAWRARVLTSLSALNNGNLSLPQTLAIHADIDRLWPDVGVSPTVAVDILRTLGHPWEM